MKHKKIFLLFLLFIQSSLCNYAQRLPENSYELKKFKIIKDSKVHLGMTAQEIRSLLGSPKAIEGGFPQSEEQLIKEFPNMVGQLNNSTWIYFYDPITVTLMKGFYINGQEVNEQEYNAYKELRMIYLLDGKVIDPVMAEGYKITKKKNLIVVPKDPIDAKSEMGQPYKASVIPVYCVIFDKGTQSVASTKAYFMK